MIMKMTLQLESQSATKAQALSKEVIIEQGLKDDEELTRKQEQKGCQSSGTH